MRAKYSTVIAILCAGVYLASIGLAAQRVLAGIGERRDAAHQEFQDMTDRASAAAVLGFMEQPFREAVRDTLLASGTLTGVIVSGPDGVEFAVEREKGALEWLDGSPRFAADAGPTRELFFAPLRVDGVRNATISATADYLDRDQFYPVLWRTLIAVLVALAAALITLAWDGAPAARKKSPPPVAGTSRDVATGLYSPHGNVSWQAYTRDRLDSELHRCASFEQDLCFLLIETTNEQAWVGAYKVFAEIAVSFFTFRDLIFERDNRGIAVILPNVDLDHGIGMAEEFSRKLKRNPAIPGTAHGKLKVGLTSRSGRLVDAERIIVEAEQALLKAIHDPSSEIVAFKSDPERYRAFIQTSQKNNPAL